MSNAAGPALRRPGQDTRGLWYVATGNARQMAAGHNVERPTGTESANTVVRFCERKTVKCLRYSGASVRFQRFGHSQETS
jgi:hypothetical protein